MKRSTHITTLIVLAVTVVFLIVSCSSVVSPESPVTTLTPRPTHRDDNPTAGAIVRSTRQARATSNSQATSAARKTAEASATAQAQEKARRATATVVARATSQAVVAAKAGWPVQLSESFADNTLGWPLGLIRDSSLAVNSRIANRHYEWTITVANGNSYWNLVPKLGPSLTDFYASVMVEFVSGEENDQSAYGLTFRHVDQDYGFFGISKAGFFRILEVHHTGIYTLYQQSSVYIDTRPGETNRIAVAAVGPDFVFFINDQVVGQMNAEIAPGQLGLGVDALNSADEARVVFSNLEIAAP